MAQPDIHELFNESRFPSGLHLLLFLLYFPFGVALALLRLFIGFHTFLVACFLPKLNIIRSVILRVMCAVLGIVVYTKDKDKRDPGVKVMVANYTSTLDHLAVDLSYPSILPCVWDLPPTLMWLLGYVDMGAKNGRDKLIANAKKHCSESSVPLLVFPEGASTSGQTGLLKFSVWPFSLQQPVQPITIKVNRPFVAKLSPSILGGRWWNDVFWFLFVPYTSFTITVLAVESVHGEESVKEYARRVQTVMAASLGIQPTTHTSTDKVEYAKRKLFVQPAPQTRSSSRETTQQPPAVDSELRVMVRQVQEVLPHIPATTISNVLAMTKDVDLTIATLLERGTAASTSDDVTSRHLPAQPKPPEPAKASTAASSFSRHANTRQMSLQERKQALIEYARQKYISKHGLS